MTDGGRHRSDRPAGATGWASVLGVVLLSFAVAGLVLAVALLVLGAA
jgi:hypothetical protein